MEQEFYDLSEEAYKILCRDSYVQDLIDDLNVIEYDDWVELNEFDYD